MLFFLCLSFSFAYEDIRDLSLSKNGLSELEIDCGAGYLKVKGATNLDAIEVEAEIVIRNISRQRAEEYLDKYLKLSLKKMGRKAVLISHFDSSRSIFNRWQKAINLTVRVPSELVLEVEDGSGYTSIQDIDADVKIDDGSGDIFIENIAGNLYIDDGSGETEVENVTGDLTIDDGSGEIDIREVGGEVSIIDGSGSLTVRDVGGDVIVDDGSGSIYINGVKKDVIIRSAGSGGVTIRNVDGRIKK
jgi:hypothetical protein